MSSWPKKRNIINFKNLLLHIKTDKEILTFGDIEIEILKFYHHKSPSFLEDIDNEKVLVSKKTSFSKKAVCTLLVTCVTIRKLSHYI